MKRKKTFLVLAIFVVTLGFGLGVYLFGTNYVAEYRKSQDTQLLEETYRNRLAELDNKINTAKQKLSDTLAANQTVKPALPDAVVVSKVADRESVGEVMSLFEYQGKRYARVVFYKGVSPLSYDKFLTLEVSPQVSVNYPVTGDGGNNIIRGGFLRKGKQTFATARYDTYRPTVYLIKVVNNIVVKLDGQENYLVDG